MLKLPSTPQTVKDPWLTVLHHRRGHVTAQLTRAIHVNAIILLLGASPAYNHPVGMVCTVGSAPISVGAVALTIIKLVTEAMVVVIVADTFRATHATQATCTNQKVRLVCYC